MFFAVGQTASSTVQATFPTEHPPSVSPTGTVLSTRGSTTLPGGGPDPSPEPTTRPTVVAPPQGKVQVASLFHLKLVSIMYLGLKRVHTLCTINDKML